MQMSCIIMLLFHWFLAMMDSYNLLPRLNLEECYPYLSDVTWATGYIISLLVGNWPPGILIFES